LRAFSFLRSCFVVFTFLPLPTTDQAAPLILLAWFFPLVVPRALFSQDAVLVSVLWIFLSTKLYFFCVRGACFFAPAPSSRTIELSFSFSLLCFRLFPPFSDFLPVVLRSSVFSKRTSLKSHCFSPYPFSLPTGLFISFPLLLFHLLSLV